MKIKTTVKYHLTPVRMAIIKKTTNNTYWQGCGGKKTLIYLLVGIVTGTAVVKDSMEFAQKTKSRTTI